MRRFEMGKRHTNQEWQTLIEQSESSSLSTLAFCKLNELNSSTFYTKRQQFKKMDVSQGFVRAEVVEKTTIGNRSLDDNTVSSIFDYYNNDGKMLSLCVVHDEVVAVAM